MTIMTVADNYKKITEKIIEAKIKADRNNSVRIMAVVKTVEAEKVIQAINLGIDLIGENRAQELLSHIEEINNLTEKTQIYKKKYEIHFIGGLQNNKVKYIIDKVDLIESADSRKLIDEINKQASKIGKIMDILLEINIGNEETKSGIKANEIDDFAEYAYEKPNVRIRGLMTIPPYGESDRWFGMMSELYEKHKKKYGFDILSMGMSGDYENAVKYGSNIVRIGSALFGNRGFK